MAAVPSGREQLDRGRQQEREPLLNPVSLFDYYLRVLDVSYIQFFQERVRIEEQYIESLAQLYQQTRYLDAQLDNGVETTTLRQAWRELRDCVDREAEAHGAFATALKNDVVNPLIDLKETTERTRKRIKEDIKESYLNHTDWAESGLPRLKAKYMRKSQEFQEYNVLEKAYIPHPGFAPIPQAFPVPATPSSASTSSTSSHFQMSLPDPTVGGLDGSSPELNAVAGLQPLGRVASRTTLPGVPLNRSLTISTSLTDLTQSSRRALRGMLGRGTLGEAGNRPVLNTILDNFGDKNSQATKAVKAKRDAEEADKEYRKAVHWLETLRLRRVATIRGGYTSLEDFLWEQGVTVKKVFQKYTDCLVATAATNSQLAVHIQSGITKASLEQDRTIQVKPFAHLDTTLKRALPPTFYFNYLVGESKDLIFGDTLIGYTVSRGTTGEPGVVLGTTGMGKVNGRDTGAPRMSKEENRGIEPIGLAQETVPRFLRLCIQDIDSRGLDMAGIYRISGVLDSVRELRYLVEKDESEFYIDPQKDDVYCVCSLLMQYLRELSEPVFRLPFAERVQLTAEREEHIQNGFKLLQSKMRRLPPVHQATLRLLIEHLARVVAHKDRNMIDPKNLYIVFGDLLFGDLLYGEEDTPKDGNVLTGTQPKDTVLEDMITYVNTLFEEPQQMSPPLPPAPMEEPIFADYDSGYTRVYDRPKRPEQNQDFAPAPPNRPDHSIHPGAGQTPNDFTPSSLPRAPLSPSTEVDTSDDRRPLPPPPADNKEPFEDIYVPHLEKDIVEICSPRRSIGSSASGSPQLAP